MKQNAKTQHLTRMRDDIGEEIPQVNFSITFVVPPVSGSPAHQCMKNPTAFLWNQNKQYMPTHNDSGT